MKEENIYVKLARDIIKNCVHNRTQKLPINLTKELDRRAGAFVSIKKKGQLRGCIGTIQPTKDNLAEEIISNAINAATRDPRFPPITEEELSDIDISVDVLEEPQEVKKLDELDPDEYGVIVEKGYRRGVLLPNLEGIDTVEEQVEIALRKAGLNIEQLDDIQLYKFRVTRYK